MIATGTPFPRSTIALGLIVGKFAPLHLGHEWMIHQAAAECERLLILSYCNPEFARCPPDTRRNWLAKRFPDHRSIVIDAPWLTKECKRRQIAVRPLPSNDSSDDEQQHFLAWLLRDVLQVAPDAFFCSESYGPRCAEVLACELGHSVKSRLMDLQRSHVAISASKIR
jgi:cytidyltransferase-like protein